MLITKNDRIKDVKVNMRGGDKQVVLENFLSPDKFPANFRVFAEIVLEPGCSIGEHQHVNECEFFFVTEGEAEYNDNGTVITIKPGDTVVCFDGETHSIANRSDKTAKFLAVVITK